MGGLDILRVPTPPAPGDPATGPDLSLCRRPLLLADWVFSPVNGGGPPRAPG